MARHPHGQRPEQPPYRQADPDAAKAALAAFDEDDEPAPTVAGALPDDPWERTAPAPQDGSIVALLLTEPQNELQTQHYVLARWGRCRQVMGARWTPSECWLHPYTRGRVVLPEGIYLGWARHDAVFGPMKPEIEAV
jgi:hypothetical protein